MLLVVIFIPKKIHPTIGRVKNTQYFQPTYSLLERRLKPMVNLTRIGFVQVWYF